MHGKHFSIFLLTFLLLNAPQAQQILSISEALETATSNYGSIRAKTQYAAASSTLVSAARKEALPNVIVSAQQDYGTVNGQNGPLFGLGGYGVASSGLPLPAQNWNAAFGALYLAHINWEVFTFGRVKERIHTAQLVAERDESDLQQEIFQHLVKVTGAYLNLLAAQRLTRTQEQNLARADTLRKTVTVRALNGLVPGVDSSLANAEVSNARSAWLLARDAEQERANQLALLMGVAPREFRLDSLFLSRLPSAYTAETNGNKHPLLDLYAKRIDVGEGQLRYLNTLKMPTVSLFGTLQTRGSGFSATYATNQADYTHNYFDGIRPTRTNYLLGAGLVWNITSLTRIGRQAEAQQQVIKGLKEEYSLIEQQLQAQTQLAATRMENARANYLEAPKQLAAAQDAYLQKTVLYRNGLTTMVDLTQSLFSLNRAEANRDISYNNIWQALLLSAAAAGDLNLFLEALK